MSGDMRTDWWRWWRWLENAERDMSVLHHSKMKKLSGHNYGEVYARAYYLYGACRVVIFPNGIRHLWPWEL